MKILQLCSRVPYPSYDGGTIAMYNLAAGLASCGNEVTILALNTKKHFVKSAEKEQEIPPGMRMDAVFIDTSVRLVGALRNFFSSDSFHVTRFYSKEFEQKLKELLLREQFDVIQLEGLPMAAYLDTIKGSGAKIAYRAHNAEHIIWERLTASLPFGIKKLYFAMLGRRLKRFESYVLNKFDVIIPISGPDADVFRKMGCRVPVHVSVVGVDMTHYSLDRSEEEFPSLFHFGAMDWMPNEEALKWFLAEIWGKIKIRFPELKFYVAGRTMPAWIKNLQERNVILVEDVKDAKKFIRSKSVMVVPLLSGSGMKVKIIEGLASGKAIVTTRIGAEGIEVTSGKNIMIADSPGEFVGAIEKCLTNKNFYDSVCAEARLLAERKYDQHAIAEELSAFYHSQMLTKKNS